MGMNEDAEAASAPAQDWRKRRRAMADMVLPFMWCCKKQVFAEIRNAVRNLGNVLAIAI